jgi:hypothetical protein
MRMSPETLAAMLGGAANQKEEAVFTGEVRKEADRIREALAKLQASKPFKVGDVIRIKPGMKHVRFPLYGQPCIVTEVFDKPMVVDHPKMHGSVYFGERLDIRIGCNVGDDFVEYCMDSRRWEIFPEGELLQVPTKTTPTEVSKGKVIDLSSFTGDGTVN